MPSSLHSIAMDRLIFVHDNYGTRYKNFPPDTKYLGTGPKCLKQLAEYFAQGTAFLDPICWANWLKSQAPQKWHKQLGRWRSWTPEGTSEFQFFFQLKFSGLTGLVHLDSSGRRHNVTFHVVQLKKTGLVSVSQAFCLAQVPITLGFLWTRRNKRSTRILKMNTTIRWSLVDIAPLTEKFSFYNQSVS